MFIKSLTLLLCCDWHQCSAGHTNQLLFLRHPDFNNILVSAVSYIHVSAKMINFYLAKFTLLIIHEIYLLMYVIRAARLLYFITTRCRLKVQNLWSCLFTTESRLLLSHKLHLDTHEQVIYHDTTMQTEYMPYLVYNQSC